MQQIIQGTVSALVTRFSFETDITLKASWVFSLSTWPSDQSVLSMFGYSDVALLASHFTLPLQHCGYVPDSCVDEWPELKMKVLETLSQEPSIQYLDLWQKILSQNDSTFTP